MRNLLTGVASAMQWTLDMAHACLDDVWGVDTLLRGFWAYMLDTLHWSVVKIFLPFLVLTSSYAALCGLFYWLEHVVRWEWLMKYKIQKVCSENRWQGILSNGELLSSSVYLTFHYCLSLLFVIN